MTDGRLRQLGRLRRLREDAARRKLGLALADHRAARVLAAQAETAEQVARDGIATAVPGFVATVAGSAVAPSVLLVLQERVDALRDAAEAATVELARQRAIAAERLRQVEAARTRHDATRRAAERLDALVEHVETRDLRRADILAEMRDEPNLRPSPTRPR
ncbi:MAG: hypothetical protein ACOYOJ_07715 [Alsobacter sp.]